MLAQEAKSSRKRPHKDYEAVFGNDHPIFLGIIEELQEEEWEAFKKTKEYQDIMKD